MFNLDLTLVLHSIAHQSAFLDAMILFCARVLPWILGAVYLYGVLLSYTRTVKPFLISVSTLGISVVVSVILKSVFQFIRPFELYGDSIIRPLFVVSDAGAFPSGHALVFSALITLGYFFMVRFSSYILFFSLVVALARVVSGVHFIYDIIGGVAIGFCIAYGVIALYKRHHTEAY